MKFGLYMAFFIFRIWPFFRSLMAKFGLFKFFVTWQPCNSVKFSFEVKRKSRVKINLRKMSMEDNADEVLNVK